MKRLILIFVVLISNLSLKAQQKFVLSGTVFNEKGETIIGAGVYISGYKIATSTNIEGYFGLNLPAGNYDILIKAIGFSPYTKNITITDKNLNIKVALTESLIALNEVIVRPDPNRERYINIFKDFFLGTTFNASRCKMINPSVLNVTYDKDERILTVDCNELLIIENQALGYEIKYLIKNFQYNYKTNIVYYEGYPYYKDLKGSASKLKRWSAERLKAYNGSTQHFFKSLYNGNSQDEGFYIYELIKKTNTNRLPDSLLLSKLDYFRKGIRLSPNDKEAQDSLRYWNNKIRVPKLLTIFKGDTVNTDTLVYQKDDNYKYINFQNILVVAYQNEKPNIAMGNNYKVSLNSLEKFKKQQVSLINLLIRPVYFYANGAVYNPRSMLFEGTWAWEKIADSVPMDYLPPKKDL